MFKVERYVTLMSDEKAPARARCAVRNALAAWEYDASVTNTVTLLASELVTNAIRHVPGAICVVLRFGVLNEVLAVEVYDESPVRPARKAAAADAESGRGLGIIEAVTAENGGRCGFKVAGGGKWVFATLKVPPVPERVRARESAGIRGGLVREPA
ncbi:ATP-binding protein [Streptomyces sioyaensis]|uniref:ATP-binding protein n=1 Tax=Streptomyces TaxID=1883 RepID=UPI0036ECD76A